MPVKRCLSPSSRQASTCGRLGPRELVRRVRGEYYAIDPAGLALEKLDHLSIPPVLLWVIGVGGVVLSLANSRHFASC
jgi:hypothetical protein